MPFPGFQAGRLPPEPVGASGKRFLARLWALLAGPRYDAELAVGISPSTSICLRARANQITRRRACRRVAEALGGAIEAAKAPPKPNPWDPKVPVDAAAIQSCSDSVSALAETLATIKRPPVRGVAIARQLAFDGRSPLFLQAAPYRKGADRRLANTVHAARRALEVSADLD
jgi:hypothetical protein